MQRSNGLRYKEARDVITELTDEIAEWREIESRQRSWGLALPSKSRKTLDGLVARRGKLRAGDPYDMVCID